ncbi:MAG: DUF4174 domain-containing protein [Catalinimonas sp.]
MELHRLAFLLFLFLVMVLSGFRAAGPSGEDVLAQHRWKHRLLLIFSDVNHPDFAAQVGILDADPAGPAERDLRTFLLFAEGGRTPAGTPLKPSQVIDLRRRYRVGAGFTVVLIGKDGTEKLRRASPLPLEELYDTIDAMPMRQREMKKGRP